MPSPLGEGQTDMPINRHHLGEVLHPEIVFILQVNAYRPVPFELEIVI